MKLAIKSGRSKVFKGVEWLTQRLPYSEMAVTGDTFPMTWADDDAIYMSSGDPMWHGIAKDEGLDIEKIEGGPTNYRISRVNQMYPLRGYGGDGPKPCGMICIEGVIYFAYQNMLGMKPPVRGEKCQHGSDAQIICSRDHGRTWEPDFAATRKPMFPGHLFGGPAFINYGKNNEGARDEFVYAVSAEQWDNGSELRLGRVPAGRIMDRQAWQWVCDLGARNNTPKWSRDLDKSVPILSEDRFIGLPDMVYLQGIKRYLLVTWHLHQDFTSNRGTDLVFFESPEPWGPFALVHFENWEDETKTPYCPRIPLKWMERDGLSGWLQHSGSWQSPDDQGIEVRPYYRSQVRKFRLLPY